MAASAWGKSWGIAWGIAWGAVAGQADSGGTTPSYAPTEHPAYAQAPDNARVIALGKTLGETQASDASATSALAIAAGGQAGAMQRLADTRQLSDESQATNKASNMPFLHTSRADTATNLIAKKETTHVDQTAQALQAAQERQQIAQAALLKRQDDELALIMILLEAV